METLYGKLVLRLFLYKTTRNLMQVTGDAGGWLRCTMGALVLCGVPAEKYWPYNVTDFDKEPEAANVLFSQLYYHLKKGYIKETKPNINEFALRI